MTILIGLKQDDFVLITGDTKSAHINETIKLWIHMIQFQRYIQFAKI
ncbi:hypothetical protein QFZ73_006042 [Peribacillus sp. V2I11]|nr:hypothetical protein [Peribacillus sp. V2I11]